MVFLLIKKGTDLLDMLNQIRIGNIFKDGEIKHVGEQQVIQFIVDFTQLQEGQILADEGQVNIRTVSIISSGTRAIQDDPFDFGMQ